MPVSPALPTTTRCTGRRGTPSRHLVRCGAYLTALVTGACHGPLPQSAMAPAGSDARHILLMHWVLVTIASLVSMAVIAATVIALGVSLPADFLMIAAMNPCPCGFWGEKGASCLCPADP